VGLITDLFSRVFGSSKLEPAFEGKRISDKGFQKGSYEICIPQGVHNSSGHILMQHRMQYSIKLENYGRLKCDAHVVIDGTHVGTWRIDGHSSIEIERPVKDEGRFTFYTSKSREARSIGMRETGELGLVVVTFMPEIPPPPPTPPKKVSETGGDDFIRESPQRGGTGLSGESAQRFTTVDALDYDVDKFVEIVARLYCDDDAPRPLTSSSGRKVPSPLP
jgi:hypothetical protein